MVMKEGLILALLGIGSGLAVALAVTRLMKALLYEVSAIDPAHLRGRAASPRPGSAPGELRPGPEGRRSEPLEAIRYK